MKKIFAVCLTLVMLFTFASCNKTNGTNTSSQNGASSQSQEQSGSSSSGTSPAQSSSRPVSNMPLYSGPEKEKSYTVKTVDYKYNENNKNYRASYPQLEKDGKDYSKVNELLKSTALQTINSIGTSGSAEAKVKVSQHVYYRGDDFISVSFSESKKSSSDKSSVSSMRMVNYDIKNGKALSAADMVQNNDALYKAVESAVQTSMSKKNAAKFTSSVIKAGLKSFNVYFKDGSMGISLTVPEDLGGHKEIKIDYEDTSGFRTSNAAWKYFIK